MIKEKIVRHQPEARKKRLVCLKETVLYLEHEIVNEALVCLEQGTAKVKNLKELGIVLINHNHVLSEELQLVPYTDIKSQKKKMKLEKMKLEKKMKLINQKEKMMNRKLDFLEGRIALLEKKKKVDFATLITALGIIPKLVEAFKGLGLLSELLKNSDALQLINEFLNLF